MENKKPFVSIVVASYNAEKKIEETIKSLINQNYPKDKYEIIVVDDCSKDNTLKIISKYPIKIIKHNKNKRLASVRNNGLKHCKGEIYVCFDDDCMADQNWLKEIVKVYQEKKDVAGVCGWIVEKKESNLCERFIQNNGCGNPLPDYFLKNKNILIRFSSYIKSKINTLKDTEEDILKVGTMSGANSTFPIKILKDVKGWDEKLSGTEDTELCHKIKKQFPKKIFYVNKKANLIHDHQMNFSDYVKRPLKRGDIILKHYQKNEKFPPIFPFPIAILFFSLLIYFYNPFLGLFSLIILPHLFYFWYLIRFVKSINFDYLIFPYMQFLLELSSLLGLVRGFILLKFKPRKNETNKK